MLKMLTGKRPPEAMTFINEEIAVEDLIPAGVSDETKSVIRKAMEPRRKKRYQDIKSFVGDLTDVKPQLDNEEDEPTIVGVTANTEAKPAERTQALPKPKPRYNKKWLIPVVGILAVAVIGILIWESGKSYCPVNSVDIVKTDSTENVLAPRYEYVDLGLPSKVKWATFNVGASSPEGSGDYFAWGEVKPKSTYTEANCNAFEKSLEDFSGNSSLDAARACWGGFWRMPTRAEWQELIDNCQWTWTTTGGKNGYKVVGRNGRSIFLPAAGCRRKGSLINNGSYGYYWSSTPSADGTPASYYLSFNKEGKNIFWNTREFGRSVRPVIN